MRIDLEMARYAPTRPAPTADGPSAPSTLASAVLGLIVLGFCALWLSSAPSSLSRSPSPPHRTTLPRTAPAVKGAETFTYVLVASDEQASALRTAPFDGAGPPALAGEYFVRVVRSASDERALIAEIAEINGFRSSLGLAEVRILDLR